VAWLGASACGEQTKAVIEPLGDLAGGEQIHACSGELNR